MYVDFSNEGKIIKLAKTNYGGLLFCLLAILIMYVDFSNEGKIIKLAKTNVLETSKIRCGRIYH
jgi:hypothetical protein